MLKKHIAFCLKCKKNYTILEHIFVIQKKGVKIKLIYDGRLQTKSSY